MSLDGEALAEFREAEFFFEPMQMSCLLTKSEADTVCGHLSSNFISEPFSLVLSHTHPAGTPDLMMNRDGEVSGNFSYAALLTSPEGLRLEKTQHCISHKVFLRTLFMRNINGVPKQGRWVP